MPDNGYKRTYAVVGKKFDRTDMVEHYPTPPWATRALCTHVLGKQDYCRSTVLEPACGSGYMAKPLSEYFSKVTASDLYDYGFGTSGVNFLDPKMADIGRTHDWIITNPPFASGDKFVIRALDRAYFGVAVFVRLQFIESIGRYERIFRGHPLAIMAPFVERVPIVKGRVDRKASTATGYMWLVFRHGHRGNAELKLIPPCRSSLERDSDYD